MPGRGRLVRPRLGPVASGGDTAHVAAGGSSVPGQPPASSLFPCQWGKGAVRCRCVGSHCGAGAGILPSSSGMAAWSHLSSEALQHLTRRWQEGQSSRRSLPRRMRNKARPPLSTCGAQGPTPGWGCLGKRVQASSWEFCVSDRLGCAYPTPRWLARVTLSSLGTGSPVSGWP